MGKFPGNFIDFWSRYLLDIGIIRVVPLIILVIVLSRPKNSVGNKLCHNFLSVFTRGVYRFYCFLCHRFLLFVVIKNHGSVLLAYVRSLSVQLGGIMGGEEYLQQCRVVNLVRIIIYLNRLCMTCLTIAHRVIGGPSLFAARIA